MVATQYPGELGVAYSPTQWYPGTTQSQQNFQGLPQLEPQSHMASTGFQHPKHVVQGSVASRTANANAVPVSKQHRSCPLLNSLLNGNPPDFMSFFKTPSFLSEEINADINFNSSIHFSDKRHCKRQQGKSSPAAPNCGKTKTQNLDYSEGVHSTPCQKQSVSLFLNHQLSTEKVLSVAEMVPPTEDQIQGFIAEKVAYFRTLLPLKNKYYGHAYTNMDRSFLSDDTDSTSQNDYIMAKPNGNAHLIANSAFDNNLEKKSLSCTVIEQCNATVGQRRVTELTPMSKETEYPQIMGNVAVTCTKNEDESPKVLTAVPVMTWDELTEKQRSSTLNCSSSKEEYESSWLNINQNLDDTDQRNVSWVLKHITERENGDTSLKPVAEGFVSMQGMTDVSEDLATKTGSVESESKTFEVVANSNLNLSTDKIQIHNVVSIPSKQSEQLFKQTSCEDARENVNSLHSQIDTSISHSENKVKEQFVFSESKSKEVLSVSNFKDLQYEDISDDEDMSQVATTVLKKGNEKLCLPPSFEDLQYEVISEDENPQIDSVYVKRPSTTHVPEPKNKQLQLENESDGHTQSQARLKTELIADEELIPKKRISLETERVGTAQHCSCSCFVETDDGLICPKCERPLGSQPNHFVSFSPSSVLKDEDENEDQMDDDWIVIPISISDLKFDDDDQEGTEKNYLEDNETGNKETKCELISVPASAASPIEEFETVEKFRQAKALQSEMVALDWSALECELDSEEESHSLQNSRESYSEPEDSCETEDSRDYSPEPERHYLTVSRQLLKKRSAPLPQESDDSVSEKENQDDEVTDVTKGQTRSLGKSCLQNLRQLIEAKAANKCAKIKTIGKNISNTDDIIILDSDTEDEGDQNCKKKRRRKRLFSSDSDNSGAASYSRQKRHSPETVESLCRTVKQKLGTNRLPSADLLAPKHQSKFHNTECKEAMLYTCSEMSHCPEKTEQLIESKCGSEHVQHEKTVIILDSDTDDDNDQNNEKANRKRLFSSGSSDGVRAPCFQQKRYSPKTVDSEFGTAQKKHTEIRLSSADSSLPLHKPKLHDSQYKEVMQDACSNPSHRPVKTRQLTEAKGDSEHVQHKTNRPTISEERRNTKRILSSASEDSDDALFTIKNRLSTETKNHFCGTASERTKNPRSSDKSPKKQLQSVGNEAAYILDPSPVIPRLVVQKSVETLKLMKESRVHMQGNDKTSPTKTLTETSKNCNSCEKNMQHLYRDKKGRFMSKSKPANGRHHSTKTVFQANKKPIQVSGQLSSPSQEVRVTSDTGSSSPSGQLSEAGQSHTSSRDLSYSGKTSASCSLSQSNQSTLVSRQNLSSSKPQLSHSYSSPSTLEHPCSPTKDPLSFSTMQSSARKLVKEVWTNSYFTTRRDKRSNLGMEKNLRTTNYDLCKEARPTTSHHDRVPRKRHSSHESETPLMKRTKSDAVQWTKAINRDTPKKQRYSVGDGYKWSEKPTVAKPTKGSGR